MIALLLAALQAAPPAPQADISLHATVDARQVRVERKGSARIAVRAAPDGGSVATSSGIARDGHFELRIDARLAAAMAKETVATEPAPPR